MKHLMASQRRSQEPKTGTGFNIGATWPLLDRTPKGRGDNPEGWPRRHDEYE
jgi:predicted dithiol-disulfide oxidoreductase (DUF899 family)